MVDLHTHDSDGYSRRGFLKSALASAGLITVSQYEAAAQMLGGTGGGDVQGWGVSPGTVQLSGNENALGPSPRAVDAILDTTYSINRYDLAPDLYGNIARRHGLPVVDVTSQFELPADAWLAVGAGSSDILTAIAHAYFGNGGELVEVSPGFGFMARLANQKGLNVVSVPLADDYGPDLVAMQAAITEKTQLVVVTTPGNPNGRLTPISALKLFVESIPSEVLILVDEAYIDFCRQPGDRIGAAPLIADHPNLIVTRTFSKVFGMAGMRVGYALAQPDVINRINENRANTLSILSGYAAAAALKDHDFVRRSQELVHSGKDYFYSQMDALGVEYVRSESSFVLINLRRDVDTVVDTLAKDHDVWVANAKQRWGMDTFIRVTAGLPEENEAFVEAFKKVLVKS